MNEVEKFKKLLDQPVIDLCTIKSYFLFCSCLEKVVLAWNSRRNSAPGMEIIDGLSPK